MKLVHSEPESHEETWESKPEIHRYTNQIPDNIQNNNDFISWAIQNVWGQSDKTNSYVAMRLLRDLNDGKAPQGLGSIHYDDNSFADNQMSRQDFSVEDAMNTLANMCDYNNSWEEKRAQLSQSNDWSSIPRPYFLSLVKPDINTTNLAD